MLFKIEMVEVVEVVGLVESVGNPNGGGEVRVPKYTERSKYGSSTCRPSCRTSRMKRRKGFRKYLCREYPPPHDPHPEHTPLDT